MPGKPKGPYTLWQDYGYEGWQFTDFATLREAVESDKYGIAWCVTKPVDYAIVEATDNMNLTILPEASDGL